MRSLTVETVGPALVVVCEIDAPIQIFTIAGGCDERDALATWLSMSAPRAVIADAARVEAGHWSRVPRGDPRELFERLDDDGPLSGGPHVPTTPHAVQGGGDVTTD